jgi:hypothetical protein
VLIALFALALLLFNFPLLACGTVMPPCWACRLFPAALFVIWGTLIAMLLGWTIERMEH